MIKLDLGAGSISPDGFTPLGNVNGTTIFPLGYGDGTVDVIRASHVLEHFSQGEVPNVLKEWIRALKPGGTLQIAVPDFGKIAEQYVSGQGQSTQGYVMGGQVDSADFHKTIFDRSTLSRALAASGLMLIRDWTSDLQDCAALPVSLNLAGTKPHIPAIGVTAVMSVPRLGFMDNFFASFEALPPLNIGIRRYTGAFWSQCIERVIEQALDEGHDAILTLDYDTVFTRRDASMLLQLACVYPEADAIAAVQAGRGAINSLFTMRGDGDVNLSAVPSTYFDGDLTKVETAHFGLTLLRTDKIRKLPKPWFHDRPAPDGSWNEGRTDADITFWRQWSEAGNSLYLANRVPVGHMDLSVRWPGPDLMPMHQPIEQWREHGKPEGAWK